MTISSLNVWSTLENGPTLMCAALQQWVFIWKGLEYFNICVNYVCEFIVNYGSIWKREKSATNNKLCTIMLVITFWTEQ